MATDLERKLKISHLRLVNAIDKHRRISAAADSISISQPAASRMLSEIEAMLGVTLFERNAKGMSPTYFGELLANRARTVLLNLSDLDKELHQLTKGWSGSVSIGAVTGAALHNIIPAVQAFKNNSPNAEVHIHVDSSNVLIDRLVAGLDDLVVARVLPGVSSENFEMTPLGGEAVKLVVNSSHPLLAKPKVNLKTLVDFEWVLPTYPSPIRSAIDAAFREVSAPLPSNVVYTTSLLVMIGYLTSSKAIMPLASEVADLIVGSAFRGNFEILPIEQRIDVGTYYLMRSKHREPPPIVKRLLELISSQQH